MKIIAAIAIALVFLTGVASAFTPTRLRFIGDATFGTRHVIVFDDASRGVVCYSQYDAISCVKVTP